VECRKLIDKVLPLQTARLGGRHEHVLRSRRISAIALRRTGALADAAKVAEQAYRDAYGILGPDN
jgi:hypothetical protein